MSRKKSRRKRRSRQGKAPANALRAAPIKTEPEHLPPAKEPVTAEGLQALLARNRLISLIVFFVLGTLLAAAFWMLLTPPS